ncbi:hypothetical protein IE53DRAFT_220746 [Violaceomyces palustris]|uniref:Uncharacterized protein n=1 Tax=Violaceomyces palustris TaxID=1673888 RepID=A0ACD0NQE0_9BASI|nr:hypothetical protein IE53DRAFT_220746 [Violaceomyces palustris]
MAGPGGERGEDAIVALMGCSSVEAVIYAKDATRFGSPHSTNPRFFSFVVPGCCLGRLPLGRGRIEIRLSGRWNKGKSGTRHRGRPFPDFLTSFLQCPLPSMLSFFFFSDRSSSITLLTPFPPAAFHLPCSLPFSLLLIRQLANPRISPRASSSFVPSPPTLSLRQL